MKNELEKWPKNWIEHIIETCFFYFEYKDISFVDSKILCSDKTKKAKIYSLRLSFQKDKNLYDVFINYKDATFMIDHYYKNYYRTKIEKYIQQNFLCISYPVINGSDQSGLFNYYLIGGSWARDRVATPYEISKNIESSITYHNYDKDKECDDDNDGENNPIEPFFSYSVMEPELLNY